MFEDKERLKVLVLDFLKLYSFSIKTIDEITVLVFYNYRSSLILIRS